MATEISDNWYENFFQGINCEIWENALPADTTLQEVAFLVSEWNLQPGRHILDIPCGFGRHAVELAKRGYPVTGIDISETFIQKLTDKIRSESLNIEAIQADILSVPLREQFSGALCLGNSFGYFNRDKMKLFVEKVAASLYTGAKFVIHSGMLAESILPHLSRHANNNTYSFGAITMEVNNSYSVQESCLISRLLYTKEGRTEEHAFKHYVFTLGEVKSLLQQSGLRTIATYSSISREEFRLGDPQVYLVAGKE
ncbi:class I SAM-dependent methyltransferase [Paraflavisolibacter sp. H34]|uniref:SAM-dependent methyltransferase n=1 Tax=Huijunlia imazamoxiresistens TaxID=3127457 RepID=UPI003016D811